MADKDGNLIPKNYSLDVKVESGNFHVKGMNNVDWGMKNRLSKIFNPVSQKSVMLAFDHGYIMGPTAGLERLDICIPPLIEDVDVLMGTRGALKTCVNPNHDKAIALRCTAGSSVLDDDMSHEIIGVDIEDAIRLNATCMAIQSFIGSSGQLKSIKNIVRAVDEGNKYGIPVLGVVAVGKEMERTSRYFSLATRMLAEFGVHIVKSYYCNDFEKVVATCPVPIVIAGGKKVPEKEALEMAYRAIQQGAAGVDMGRNIFQAESPKAMAIAIKNVVHNNFNTDEAFELYNDLKHQY